MHKTLESSAEIHSIYTAFSETTFGEHLAGKVRYERYNTGSLSNGEWVELLGSDVNNLTHMPLTRGLAQSFIAESHRCGQPELTPMDAILLKVAAIIHDQGEAIKGDITFSDKTETDELEEHAEFERNALGFLPNATDAIRSVIVQARDEIAFNKETRLGKIFNAIERVGYMRTTLRAAEHIIANDVPSATSGLRWLLADTLGNQTEPLLQHRQTYVPVKIYLDAQADKISQAFGLVMPDDFKNYGEQAASKEAQFDQAYLAWQLHYPAES